MLMGNIAGCSPSYGTEINTTQICTAPVGVTEANATTGWSNYFGLCNPFQSSATDSQLGTYKMSFGSSSFCQAYYTYPTLTDDQVYRVTYYAKAISGTTNMTSQFRKSTNSTTMTQSIVVPYTATTWTLYTDYMVGGFRDNILFVQPNPATYYVDNISIKPATLCYGSELNVNSDATSITNEANSLSMWTATTVNAPDVLQVVASGCDNGTYCINATDAGNATYTAGFYIDLTASPFSLQDGHQYLVKWKAKHNGVGTKPWECGFRGDTTHNTCQWCTEPTVELFNDATTYQNASAFLVYDSTKRYFGCSEGIQGDSGGQSGMILDSFSIKEVTGK
jgi:hypothetical protein